MSRCHTLRGCVDWNSTSSSSRCVLVGHTLRGCVDWNDATSGHLPMDMMSHPSWVCGLKRLTYIHTKRERMSHPSWVCGLKPPQTQRANSGWSHTLRGCVDWNIKAGAHRVELFGHTLRGCVDWNTHAPLSQNRNPCHTLRGCVDWNVESP